MEENNQNKDPREANDFEFLKEKIKERPVNKKKLLQRTLITASLALLFGLVACLTFLLLEPVLNNWLYPEEQPKVVTFPQEKDEMKPQDMLTEEEEQEAIVQQLEESARQEDTALKTDKTQGADSRYESPKEQERPANEAAGEEEIQTAQTEEETAVRVEEYQVLYHELNHLYQQIATSMVTVTGVKSDVDWFNNTYQSEGQTAGVIIANNNKELLILTRKSPLEGTESISITFCNDKKADAYIKKYDVNTNLAVIAVDLKYVNRATLETITVAELGSSNDTAITGMPVMAIGNLLGYRDTVCYGVVTSMGNQISLADNQYNLLTTDIYASRTPSGILVNMKGQVIGIVENTYNNEDTKNLLSAIGITELKGMITKLSNGVDIPYLGIYAQDISEDAKEELAITNGSYISNIDLDSPAMVNGIQKGDIIIKVEEREIASATDYMNAVRSYPVGGELTITVLRASKDAYEEMTFTVKSEARE